MRDHTVTVYKFDELSEEAKEKARDWWRRGEMENGGDCETVFEDAATIADLFGLDIRQTRKTNSKSESWCDPTIYFSGFWSQGDGACFKGTYRYKKGALAAVKAYAPKDEELHRITKELQAIQRRYFYRLTASCKHRGNYYHSGCMSVDVEDAEDSYRNIGTAEDDITQLMRDFADWIYKKLENEYDYRMSDEQVDDAIIVNEYEFTEDGERV